MLVLLVFRMLSRCCDGVVCFLLVASFLCRSERFGAFHNLTYLGQWDKYDY